MKLIRPLEDGSRLLQGVLLRAEENGEFEVQLDEETSCTLQKKECSSVNLLEDDFSE